MKNDEWNRTNETGRMEWSEWNGTNEMRWMKWDRLNVTNWKWNEIWIDITLNSSQITNILFWSGSRSGICLGTRMGDSSEEPLGEGIYPWSCQGSVQGSVQRSIRVAILGNCLTLLNTVSQHAWIDTGGGTNWPKSCLPQKEVSESMGFYRWVSVLIKRGVHEKIYVPIL